MHLNPPPLPLPRISSILKKHPMGPPTHQLPSSKRPRYSIPQIMTPEEIIHTPQQKEKSKPLATSARTSTIIESITNIASQASIMGFPTVLLPTNSSSSSSPSSSSFSSSPVISPVTSPFSFSTFTQNTLTKIHEFSIRLIDDWMKSLINKQMRVLQEINPNFSAILEEQKTMARYIDAQISMLAHLVNNTILTPPTIAAIANLRDELHLFASQLSLLLLEVLDHGTPDAPPTTALIIRKQPFPFVIMHNKQLGPELLQVQLLTGAKHKIAHNKKVKPYVVKATLLGDKPPTGEVRTLENNSHKLNEHGIARFPVRFPVGTHRSIVHLKFTMRMDDESGLIESQKSNPFIVLTNESQWSECFGTLIKQDAFQDTLSVTWPRLANILQQHFVLATRQDIVSPKRPLSLHDLDYLHNRFFSRNESINQQDFDAFWSWFGTCMRVLRFQRHVRAMWQCGIIYGFMDREEAEYVQKGQPVGTFLIRFAESPPGRFDIVFVGYELTKHYLVKDEDIKGAKRTFPDFLLSSGPLINLLRYSSNSVGEHPTFTLVPKNIILHPYITPAKQDNKQDGYQKLSW